MTPAHTQNLILGLILASLAGAGIEIVPTWVPNLCILAAAVLALHDYGRRGGAEKPVTRSARLASSGGMTALAICLVCGAVPVAIMLSDAIGIVLAAAGAGIALLGSGVRIGVVESRQPVSGRDAGNESRLVVLSALGAAVAIAVLGTPFPRAVALVAAAGLIALGYARRPAVGSDTGA